MLSSTLLLLSLPLLTAAQSETLLGAYIFHRHGDRTTKFYPPTTLTPLGYTQVVSSGSYYRARYLTSTSPLLNISPNLAVLSQLSVESPVDNVLQSSAYAWLQGLYPPVGQTLGAQTLANGSTVETPLNGYQIIPVNAVASASSSANSENSAWLQGSSGCENAIVSSNNYFISDEYNTLLNSTQDFYQGLLPVINGTFSSETDTYKNAYSIYDFVHVSTIHNASTTIPSDALLTPSNLLTLQNLANAHEFGLAYNSSSPIRAIAGATLAAQILQSLNATLAKKSKSAQLSVQFGAYASFLSFFGLADLPAVSDDFTGIVDYASSMAFELVTTAAVNATSYPSLDDVSVRFMFSNRSAAESGGLQAYPLFGKNETTMSWNDFVTSMQGIAIGDQVSWCKACGNSTGVCAPSSTSTNSSSSTGSGSEGSGATASSGGSGGVSRVVAGVIGAMVTLAVILGLEALIMLVAGLRLARKHKGGAVASGGNGVKA